MKIIKIKSKKQLTTVFLILVIIFSGYTWMFNEYFYELNKNSQQYDDLQQSYNPLLNNYTYINDVTQSIYEFNAKGECYLLADLKGTDFTSLKLDNDQYNLSYGINIFSKDFGYECTAHTLEFQQADIDNDNFKWVCVEPLFIAMDNITVNLDQPETIYFKAGGPISILMQPNFSYNWLYLEVDGVVINDIYHTDEYPEFDSIVYSYFVEDGAYIRFDLDTTAKDHVMKVKGDGTIEYKIIVNLDWDEDLIHDVEEVQKELFIEDLNPIQPNIWGFFEKSSKFSASTGTDDIREGSFRFYVPESYIGYRYLHVVLFSGTILDIQLDDDKLTLKDVVVNNSFGNYAYKKPFGIVDTGYHTIYYKYYSNETTKITFNLDGRELIIFDKAEFKDTDGDGLKDIEERNSGLDPYNSDTDNDGVPDNLDVSPLYSLTLNKGKIHQFVIPHDSSRNTLISMSIKRPNTDYSTFATPRLYRGDLNVSIYFYMRVFGNQSISRTNLATFWKDDANNVDSFSLVDNYDCSGVGDALPVEENPNAEFIFINGKFSENTYEFDLSYSKDNPAKDDNLIDLRFDFIWIVTSYNSESGNTTIIHIYDVEENLKLQSFGCREIGDINYKLASPDSMIENQILWALTQNPQLGTTNDYGMNDDVVGEGTIDFMDLFEQLLEDREKNPILRETFDDVNTQIIKPDGDVITEWSPTPLWERIIEYPLPSDGLAITGSSGDICEFSLSSFQMEENKAVSNIKLYVRGKIDGLYILEAYWRIGDGGLSSKKYPNIPVQELPEIPVDDGWASVEWSGLQLSQSALDDLRLRFRAQQIYGGGGIRISTVYIEITYQEFGDPIENEVLYVAGMQKNLDVLNKINIQQNFVNPNFEVLHLGDYESYFSYYSVSNVYDSSEIQFLDEVLRGEHKICYTITWNNYSEECIEDYEKRAIIQGLPISMDLITFSNSKVLKITQAMGNQIPLNEIPNSVSHFLHDKITFWNQTYIELPKSLDNVPLLQFQDGLDIYKEFFDDRPWQVETSKLIFTKYSKRTIDYIIEVLGNTQFDDFITMFKGLVNDYYTALYLVAGSIPELGDYYKKFHKYMNSNLFTYLGINNDPNLNLKSIDDLMNIIDDSMIKGLKNQYPELNDKIDLLLRGEEYLKDMSRSSREMPEFQQKDPLGRLQCWVYREQFKQRLIMSAIGGALIALGTFLTIYASIELFQLHYNREDYEGREPEFVFRMLAAHCSLAMGFAVTLYGILIMTQAITRGTSSIIVDNINELAEKAVMKLSKYLGHILNIIGILLDLFNFLANLAYAMSIMNENPELATQIIVQSLIFDLGIGVAWGILSYALGSTAAAAIGFAFLGVAVISIIIFTLIFCFFVDPVPDEYLYPLGIELGMDYSKDDVKKHGGFEIGDSVNYEVGLRNLGSVVQYGATFGVKAKFQLRLNYSNSNVDDWSDEYGRWDPRIDSIYAPGYLYFGENAYPAFWPSDADAEYYCREGDFTYNWPTEISFEYESYDINRILTAPSTGLVLELKLTKDKYEAQYQSTNYPDPADCGYYYERYAWVEDEIIRINLGFPVLETSISAFYSYTTPLPELTSFSTLETKLQIALAQYRYKDANEILSQLQQRDPDYECDIPIDTNIATNLQENIIELDPITGSANVDFSLILDGNDLPNVDITISPPECFSVNNPSFTQSITSSISFSLSVNDINEFGGIYYFDMEIQRHDTGEFIYRETVPFRMPFVQDFTYLQTNILYHDSNVYEQTLISDILDPPLELLKGQIVNIKCKTTTSNEVLLEFLNNNNPIDTYTVISRGNDNFGEQFVQIIIRKDITVDQFKFSVNLENEQYFMAHDIVFMDSLITTPEGEWFTPISVTNDGNVIEFVEFSFSGVSFDNIDTSMYTEEFYKKTQLITLMPGEHRDCMFKITSPTTPIDNLYWRGIRTYDPITDEVYIGYADSLEIEGIHIQTPKNETYNIFGINNNFEVGIPLEIVAEDDLLWSTYSLDNSPEVIFSERIYIPLSKIDGIHSLKVYGETTSNQLISSETRYFTVEHAITILNPTNTTISGPSLGYYIATYGFEGDWDGSISFVDQNYGGAGCTLKIISELDGHNDVLKLEDIGSGGHQAIHIFDEGAQQYGTIEFWWRTSDATDNQNLQPRASNGIDRLFRLRIDNDILEYYDGSWHTIINQWKDNEWHHFRIDFEQTGDYYQGLSENEWQLYVDGVKYGPYGFEVDIIPDRLYLHTDSSGTHDVYYDAFGFSWDNQYSIGDNLKEGILFDTISKIKIDDLRYKLDNGDYIYSPTSFVLPKLENGAYSLIFYGFDDYGNEWSSEKRWFTIEEDFDPPQMTGIQVIYDPLELGESQTIITSIIDGSGIRTITAYIQFPDGTTIAELPMKNIGGDKYKATWNYESAHLGVYYIDINTIDASFNSNNLYIDNAIVYDLEDTINPVISNILVSNNPLDRFDIQTITCNIEDLSSLQTVTAYIQYPDGTNIASLQMTNVVGDTYEAQWDSSSAAYGNYYVDIEAIDASPNQNLGYFDNGAMFSVIEPPAPTIDIISPSNGATISGYKTIRAVASSKAGITKVQFKIDGVLKREDTNGADGWSYYWNTNTVSNGGHTITCKAFDSLGRTEIDSISVTVQNSAGGGGGCPYLSVYNGDQYIPEGLLDIHNVDGIDVKFYHTLNTEPLAVNNRYHLRLTEHYKTISHIDNVRLYGRLSNGLYLLLPLLSATHSVLGQVTLALWFSDDVKVGVLGADHTNGMSEFIDLEFIAFWPFTFSEFVFVIEGNNYIIK